MTKKIDLLNRETETSVTPALANVDFGLWARNGHKPVKLKTNVTSSSNFLTYLLVEYASTTHVNSAFHPSGVCKSCSRLPSWGLGKARSPVRRTAGLISDGRW